MTEAQKIQIDLDNVIQNGLNNFDNTVSSTEKQLYLDIQRAVKDLDLDGDTIKNSVSNIKAIGKIKKLIEKSILKNKVYVNGAKQFTSAFTEISKLQNTYFNSILEDFKAPKVLDTIRQQSIQETVSALTESGISSNISKPITDLIKASITSGGSYNDLLKQLNASINTNETGEGLLKRYTKQITTDSLNQYSAQYNTTIGISLGFEWMEYIGSNLDTTRCFCDKATEKRYIHNSELDGIIKNALGCPINPKTELWYGAIAGTNAENFKINRGGWGCGHQVYFIPEYLVPKNLLDKFKNK